MYAELIYKVFLEGSICRQGTEWLLPMIHQSILYYGAEKTYSTMIKNSQDFRFFRIFPVVINSKFYSNVEHVAMIGDAWNIMFNPHLPLISPIKDIVG